MDSAYGHTSSLLHNMHVHTVLNTTSIQRLVTVIMQMYSRYGKSMEMLDQYMYTVTIHITRGRGGHNQQNVTPPNKASIEE